MWEIVQTKSELIPQIKNWIQPTQRNLEQEVNVIMELLHGKARQEFYKICRSISKKRDTQAAITFRDLRAPRPNNSLTILKVKDKLVTDEVLKHSLLTSHFKNIFKAPHEALPLGLYEKLTQFDDFVETLGVSHIPNAELRKVHRAIYEVKRRTEVANKLSDLDKGPILADFVSAIRKAPSGKSGGPSKLTYDMLRALSIEAVQTIHSWMTECWEAGLGLRG